MIMIMNSTQQDIQFDILYSNAGTDDAGADIDIDSVIAQLYARIEAHVHSATQK